MARIVSINVARPATITHRGQAVQTAIDKRPVAGRVSVGKLNIAGDAQADLIGHGGEKRAILVYQTDSYQYWADYLKRAALPYGTFGENLTVEGLSDEEVCVGDRLRAGSAIFEVSQPRVTCFKLGIKLGHPSMPALLVAHRRPGFYLRVIEEGEIAAGDAISLLEKEPARLSVAAVNALLYSSDHDTGRIARALRIPALSDGWKTSFARLLAAADQNATQGNAGLTTVRQPPAWTGYRALRIASSRLESAGVRSFELADPEGAPLSTSRAGQYVGIRVRPSTDGSTIARSYSLCGDPRAPTYRIAVKNDGGVMSGFLHAGIRVGETVDVSAPRGDFVLASEREPAVLLGAGIGVTPLLAMLYAAAAEQPGGRTLWWVHSARSGQEHAFASEARQLIDRIPGARSVVFYSKPGRDDRAGADFQLEGRLDLAQLVAMGMPLEAHFYLCGPSAYLVDTRAGLNRIGVPDDRIHQEAFGPAASDLAVKPHLPDGVAGDGAVVNFARSGLSVPWNARFGSLLELAEACSVPVSWSCRTGICHRCESGLVAGTIAYEPEPFDSPPQGAVLLCCATPEGEVALDL